MGATENQKLEHAERPDLEKKEETEESEEEEPLEMEPTQVKMKIKPGKPNYLK